MQWPKTRAAVLYSENEPCGIMPMEVRLLARDTGTVLVLSDSGGFPEQATHGVDSILGGSGDAAAARAIRQALELSDTQRTEMVRQSVRRVLRESTWTGRFLRTLVELRPQLGDVAAEIGAILDEENLVANGIS